MAQDPATRQAVACDTVRDLPQIQTPAARLTALRQPLDAPLSKAAA